MTGRLHSILGFTPLSQEASACPGRGRSCDTGFAFLKDSRRSWLFLGQLGKKKWAYLVYSHIVVVET